MDRKENPCIAGDAAMSIPVNPAILARVAALEADGGTSAARVAKALGLPHNTAADYLRRVRGKLVAKRRKRCIVCDSAIAKSYCAACRRCMDGMCRARRSWEKYETHAKHAEIERRVETLAKRVANGEPLFEVTS